MAKISAQDFVGTRTRFQRMSDARIFSGWIESFFGNKLVVGTTTSHLVKVDDEYRFEGFGDRISVVFNAKLESVGLFKAGEQGLVATVDGTSAKLVEPQKFKLELQVVSPVRFAASTESIRVLAPEVFTVLYDGDRQIEGFMVDLATQGIGFVSKKPVKPKQYVKVVMETRIGKIEATGSVRYCLPDKARPKMYRTGIMFMDLDRINRPRWQRFLKLDSNS